MAGADAVLAVDLALILTEVAVVRVIAYTQAGPRPSGTAVSADGCAERARQTVRAVATGKALIAGEGGTTLETGLAHARPVGLARARATGGRIADGARDVA